MQTNGEVNVMKKIIGVAALAALAALCLIAAVACGGKTYQVRVDEKFSDIFYLADAGTYDEGGYSTSAIKAGETRAYDVVLHNGYERATLKLYANDVPVTFTPATSYNDDVDIASGYQVVGTADIPCDGKDVIVTAECKGKDFEISFMPADGVSADDPALNEFSIGTTPLGDYISNGLKLVLNYTDVKDTFTFPIGGPVRGTYEFQNNNYAFMTDGERSISIHGEGEDLNAYSCYFFADGLRRTGKTITVDPRGLYLNTWRINSLSGSLVQFSETQGWDANERKSVSVTLDSTMLQTYKQYIDISDAVLYINDTAVEMDEVLSYTLDTFQKSPASFLSAGNQTSDGGTVYSVRLEGVDVTVSEASSFASVQVSSANEGVVFSAEEMYVGEFSYNDMAVYAENGQYYFLTQGQPKQALCAFKVNASGTEGLRYELTLKYDAELFVEQTYSLSELTFAEVENGEGFKYCDVTGNGVTAQVVYDGAYNNSAISAADSGSLYLCFELSPGYKYLVNFN